MAAHGPVPKRTSQRLGHLTKAEKAAATTIKAAGAVAMPDPDPTWHPLATSWYRSLSDSAQSKLMEPSDWAAASLTAHELSRMLASEAPNAALFGRLWAAMGELMTTEGARRRLKIEVERKALSGVPAPVTVIHGDLADL